MASVRTDITVQKNALAQAGPIKYTLRSSEMIESNLEGIDTWELRSLRLIEPFLFSVQPFISYKLRVQL